jgi:hypothetical protein
MAAGRKTSAYFAVSVGKMESLTTRKAFSMPTR